MAASSKSSANGGSPVLKVQCAVVSKISGFKRRNDTDASPQLAGFQRRLNLIERAEQDLLCAYLCVTELPTLDYTREISNFEAASNPTAGQKGTIRCS